MTEVECAAIAIIISMFFMYIFLSWDIKNILNKIDKIEKLLGKKEND